MEDLDPKLDVASQHSEGVTARLTSSSERVSLPKRTWSDASRDHPPILPHGKRPLATAGILPALRTAEHLFLKREEDGKEIINSSTTHKTVQGPEYSVSYETRPNQPPRQAGKYPQSQTISLLS